MTIHKHEICLESDQHFDGRLPTHHFGFLMADLPVAIRGAVSMALRNRSKAAGKQPTWLRKASDIRFTGHGGTVSHICNLNYRHSKKQHGKFINRNCCLIRIVPTGISPVSTD